MTTPLGELAQPPLPVATPLSAPPREESAASAFEDMLSRAQPGAIAGDATRTEGASEDLVDSPDASTEATDDADAPLPEGEAVASWLQAMWGWTATAKPADRPPPVSQSHGGTPGQRVAGSLRPGAPGPAGTPGLGMARAFDAVETRLRAPSPMPDGASDAALRTAMRPASPAAREGRDPALAPAATTAVPAAPAATPATTTAAPDSPLAKPALSTSVATDQGALARERRPDAPGLAPDPVAETSAFDHADAPLASAFAPLSQPTSLAEGQPIELAVVMPETSSPGPAAHEVAPGPAREDPSAVEDGSAATGAASSGPSPTRAVPPSVDPASPPGVADAVEDQVPRHARSAFASPRARGQAAREIGLASRSAASSAVRDQPIDGEVVDGEGLEAPATALVEPVRAPFDARVGEVGVPAAAERGVEPARTVDAPTSVPARAPSPRERQEAVEADANRLTARHAVVGAVDVPELGHVRVGARHRGDAVDLAIVVERAEVAVAIEHVRGELQRELRNDGVRVATLDVITAGGGDARRDDRQPSAGRSDREPHGDAAPDARGRAPNAPPTSVSRGRVRIVL